MAPLPHGPVTRSAYHANTKSTNTERITGDDQFRGITGAIIKLHVNPPAKGMIPKATIKMNETWGGFNVSEVGKQGVLDICQVYTMPQVIGNSLSPAPAGLETAIPFTDINMDLLHGGSGFWPSELNSFQNKLCLKYVGINIDLVNEVNVPVFVDLYVVRAKQHIVKGASGVGTYNARDLFNVWSDALKEGGHGTAEQIFSPTGAGVVGYENFNQPYARPTEAYGFNKMYKVLKVHSMHLGPSASEHVSINIDYNQVIDVNKVCEIATLSTAARGFSTASLNCQLMKGGINVFALFRGMPGASATNAGVGTAYSYSNAKIAFCCTRKLAFQFLKAKTQQYTSVMASNVVYAGGAATTQVEMSNTDNKAVPVVN